MSFAVRLFVLSPRYTANNGGTIFVEIKFLKVEFELMAKHGVDTAVFISYLKFVELNRPKDDYGYFCFDSKYALNVLPFGLTKFKRIRKKAVEAKLVDYIPGNNQNQKPRYKVCR